MTLLTENIKESQSVWSGSNQYSSWGRIYFFFSWKKRKGKRKAHKIWHLFLLRGSRVGGRSWTPSISTALCSQPSSNWAWPGTSLCCAMPWGSISGPMLAWSSHAGCGWEPQTYLTASEIQRPKSCSGSPTICSTASFLFPLLWKLFLEAALIFFSSIN